MIEHPVQNYIEKCKIVRGISLSPMKHVAAALLATSGSVDAAINLLIERKQADATTIANRTANNNIVYSYVHNYRIGAMIILASQTDFVSRNQLFLDLAKDICMHIVSWPTV